MRRSKTLLLNLLADLADERLSSIRYVLKTNIVICIVYEIN